MIPTVGQQNDSSAHEIRHIKLCGAARQGNWENFMKYVDGTPVTQEYDKIGWTPLTCAAFGGNIKIVQHLISKGTDTNQACSATYTPFSTERRGRGSSDHIVIKPPIPIHFALQEGHLKVAKILVENGAKFDLMDTSTHKFASAVVKGQKDTVECLLKAKVDVNQKASDRGITSLCLAALLSRLDIVKLLVDAGANVNHSDAKGLTPLIYAISGDNLDVAEYLISQGCETIIPRPIEQNDIILSLLDSLKAMQPLFKTKESDGENTKKSIEISNLGVIKYLVGRNVDIQKYVSLSKAVLSGHLHVVEYLISQGCNVNEIDSDGNTPLINAVKTGNEDVLTKLINLGGDICRSTQNGITPLSQAVKMQNLPFIQFLLDNGAQPTLQTAFFEAIQTGNLEIVQYLETRGAVVDCTSQKGQTPLVQAVEAGHLEIAKYLVQCGADPQVVNEPKNRFLTKYVNQKNFEMVKFLVELGVKLDFIGDDGFTPLRKSVETDNFQLVKFFIEKGVDVNFMDDKQKTALSIAASKRYFSISKLLIESDADIELARSEVVDFCECNEDFAFFLRMRTKSVSNSVSGLGHEESNLERVKRVKRNDFEKTLAVDLQI